MKDADCKYPLSAVVSRHVASRRGSCSQARRWHLMRAQTPLQSSHGQQLLCRQVNRRPVMIDEAATRSRVHLSPPNCWTGGDETVVMAMKLAALCGRGTLWGDGDAWDHQSLDDFAPVIRRGAAPKHVGHASHLTPNAWDGLRRDSRTAGSAHPLSSIKIAQGMATHRARSRTRIAAICRRCRGAERSCSRAARVSRGRS